MPNRLIHETSPYLLQHAHNPVDWYPWGEEAFVKAKAEGKPVFLSVGYSACHWCHRLREESFEDPDTARLLNELFVPIKVDREERPDLDDIYMQAVQAMTGSGGWPMSVFLTPEGQPFYGGTYFPPADRYGMPSFRTVLRSVAKAWRERRAEIVQQAGQMAESLRPTFNLSAAPEIDPELLQRAARGLAAHYDPVHGGFGQAPKFPQPMTLEALLRAWYRGGDPARGVTGEQLLGMVTHTLERMARGGIYDQIGGGFARYSTDPDWLVPHFEKMLYDNAQLVRLYTRAWQATRAPLYARVVAETVEWLLRDMTDAAGGFYSTLDADSEGHEGRFYLWSMSEIEDVLGHEDARLVNLYYGLFDGPNFEGRNILHVPRDADDVARTARVDRAALDEAVARAQPQLRATRARRVWPGRDEKVLAAWNGLMLSGLAEAARVFGRDDWRAAAEKNAEFVLAALRRPDGRLLRSWKAGQAKLDAYLEDYAFMIEGLLALYQLTFEPRWFIAARELADVLLAHFVDPQWGFFDTSDDAEALIVRPKNVQDNALPSGNASAAMGLLALSAYTGEERYAAAVLPALRAIAPAGAQYPQAFGYWLCASDFAAGPLQEIALAGDPAAADTRALLSVAQGPFRPNAIVALSPEGAPATTTVPLLAGRTLRDGRATAYVCEHFACQLPVHTPEELEAQLRATGNGQQAAGNRTGA